MTSDQFWEIVESAHCASGGDMDSKCKILDGELRRLAVEEVRSFRRHFDECVDRAYTYTLWGAAYIIGGGCSDDGFSDFRATLISMGKDTFERTLADPQCLADMNYDPDTARYEGYQYVLSIIEKDLGAGGRGARYQPHPSEPAGESWDDDTVAALHSKFARKYGYGATRKGWLRRLLGLTRR